MERGKAIVRVSLVGVLVNVILVCFKALVGFASGSVAVIMDALNNLTDVLSSVITIVGTKIAGKEPDKDHPYGHGQVEYVTGVTVAVVILAAGAGALVESVRKIVRPVSARYTVLSLVIIAVSVAGKLLLGRYVRAQGRRLNSEALMGSGTDAMMDALISLSTLVGAAVSMIWHVNPEGWLGAVIALVMLRSGAQLLMDGLGQIIGARVDSELTGRLQAFICRYPGVLGAYDLSLHRYGPEKIIGSVHVEVPDDMTARDIHSLTRDISWDVAESFGILLTVGIYASNTSNPEFSAMKAELGELIGRYPEVLQMHGFYVDTGRALVTFDLIIDFSCRRKEQIRDELIDEMKRRHPEYGFAVILDSDISFS